MKARIIQLDDTVLIVGKTVDPAQLHPIHHNCIRLQLSAEDRTGDRPPDLSVEDTMPRDLVRELVLESLHVEVAHLRVKVEQAKRIDRPVQNHINHR